MNSSNPLPDVIWQAVSGLAGVNRVWLVGGSPRDHLLQRRTLDADFVLDGDARRLARKVAGALGANYYDLDRDRGSGRVLFDRAGGDAWVLDFTALRGETIEDDLRARDFTVNALAIDLAQPDRLIDPTGGLADLRAGILRACSQHAVADDPVRSLRAVRLAADLGFHIEATTLRDVQRAGPALDAVSAERIRDEIFRILGGANATGAVRTLDHLGLMSRVLPEVSALHGVEQSPPHAYDAFDHTLAVLESLISLMAILGPTHDPEGASRMTLAEVSLKLGRFRRALSEHLNASLSPGRRLRHLLCLAVLFHDVGKARTKPVVADGRTRFPGHEEVSAGLVQERARSLKLSTRETARLTSVVRWHDLPAALDRAGEVTRLATYRYFHATGRAGIDIGLLSLADRLGMYLPPIPQEVWRRRVEVVRVLYEAYFEADWLNPPRLLSGDELVQSLGIQPGPAIGRLLAAIREAQAIGEVRTRAQAIDLARRMREGSPGSSDASDHEPADPGS